jgi:hypothetical protein
MSTRLSLTFGAAWAEVGSVRTSGRGAFEHQNRPDGKSLCH